jgi:ATP-dependent Zn protease
MPRPHRQLTAFHEAGHAVIARVLTLASARVSIRPDNCRLGYSITFDRYECLIEWAERGYVRHYLDAVWHAHIITTMAGAEAEELLGQSALGDGEDRHQIELMAKKLTTGDWGRLEPRLRAMTRMLVRRHRARIERLAKVLLAKTTLSAKQVDKLVGKSVDDVKMNVPFLLEMFEGHDNAETAPRRITDRHAEQM